MEYKHIQSGQKLRYGDYYRRWEITETGDSEIEEIINCCLDKIYKHRIPGEAEYKRNIVVGGNRFGDRNYYFAGYYTLTKTNNGYLFTVCEPYCD